ncbi:hypothetical protein EU538_13195 [Candidatus Thorarchaeota archaeon]|nr:MAG: hypothetical protein EU538_13195 [Candidatus Thorarchaeota archaeon]
MAVLLDSNVIIALLNSRDANHSAARDLLTELKRPEFGMRVTLDYVLDEVLTTLWMHTVHCILDKLGHQRVVPPGNGTGWSPSWSAILCE